MNPEVECIETEGTIISLQDYQPESEPASSKEIFQAMAVGKIAEELKTFHGGQKEKCVSSHVAAQITHFCEESPEFAEVVYKTKRTLSDCCAEVLKDAKEYASDIDVYRGIVKAYFPNADVRFLMNIEINGAAPSEEDTGKAHRHCPCFIISANSSADSCIPLATHSSIHPYTPLAKTAVA